MFQECPTCKTVLDTSAFQMGQQVRCPGCMLVLTISEQNVPTAAPVPAAPKKSNTCLIVGLVVGCGFLVVLPTIAAIAIPGLLRARIASNESAAIGRLRSISTSQAQWASAAIVDVDGDGQGEHGYLQELAGTASFRTKDGFSMGPVSPAFLTEAIGWAATAGLGIADHTGYSFIVYLPDGAGGWTREAAPLPAGSAAAADDQEKRFVVYAWPTSLGNSGNRAFVVTETGVVFATANRDFQDYDGALNVPSATAAFEPTQGLVVANEIANDHYHWVPAGN